MGDAEKIAVAVVEALEGKRKISQDTHHAHHDYIETMIIKEQKRSDSWDQIRFHLTKFSVFGVFTFFVMAIWHYVAEIIKNGGVPPQ